MRTLPSICISRSHRSAGPASAVSRKLVITAARAIPVPRKPGLGAGLLGPHHPVCFPQGVRRPACCKGPLVLEQGHLGVQLLLHPKLVGLLRSGLLLGLQLLLQRGVHRCQARERSGREPRRQRLRQHGLPGQHPRLHPRLQRRQRLHGHLHHRLHGVRQQWLHVGLHHRLQRRQAQARRHLQQGLRDGLVTEHLLAGVLRLRGRARRGRLRALEAAHGQHVGDAEFDLGWPLRGRLRPHCGL
mmetsp:Transcript_86777/g.280982  ORF Transcript_86777/g.280982 Transcript_86777/m.280982 type:complete len:243 (+) Transcript_86777:535-1263(+)